MLAMVGWCLVASIDGWMLNPHLFVGVDAWVLYERDTGLTAS
jgi:hypothetical protein